MQLLIGMVLFAAPSSSRADTGEPIVLTYEAEGACPSQADFFEMVHAYTRRWSLAAEGTPNTRTIRARAEARSTDGSGHLTVTNTSGKIFERSVVAPSCEAVTQALAIMVAVAIDPEALSEGHSAPAPELPAPLPLPPRPPPLPPPPPPLSPSRETRPVAPLPDARTTSEPRPRVRVSTGLSGGVTSAVVDAAMPVVDVSLEVEPSLASLRFIPSWFRASVAVGVRQSLPTEIRARRGSVEFLWTAAHLRLCPLGVSLRERLEIALCAATDLGSLRARARGFKQVGDSSIFWLDVSGSAHAMLSLTKHVFLSTGVEAIVPYSRRPFELSTGRVVSEAPAVGFLGEVGAGLRF